MNKVYILGDSYSTFEGYVSYENASYYSEHTEGNDVKKYEDTWMYHFSKDTDCEIVKNDSWSGSTICNTGYGHEISSKSFIKRLQQRIDEGFFKTNKIDKILIMGGTNDSWADSPLGSIKYNNWTDEDLLCVFPAMTYLIHLLLELTDKDNIVFILNKEEFKDKIYNGYTEILKKYQIDYIEYEKIDKIEGHPTIKGMKQIANAISENVKF